MYKCRECGYKTLKWMGRCPECGTWDSFEEIREEKESRTKKRKVLKPQLLSEISTEKKERIETGVLEFDRVIGGGIVPGSLVLISGDPGIGKSTLLLMLSGVLAKSMKILYVSGEESISQLRLRAERVGIGKEKILILSETNIEDILSFIQEEFPDIVIIDSIQTMTLSEGNGIPGSVSMVRGITAMVMEIAKKKNITVFLVGHITKSGNIAGPMALEHMVDAVLFMEGDKTHSFRLLRSKKNRFGSTDEVGIFEMDEKGLKEVKNPSRYLISGKEKNSSGSVIIPTIEGTRPLLIEVQALVIPTRFSYPQRIAQGFHERKLDLLIAVIQKRLMIDMNNYDVYCNIAGGMSIFEPSIDLGIIISILSSLFEKPVSDQLCMVGEVGLSGEVRGVPYIVSRIQEASRIGFKKIIVPDKGVEVKSEIEVLKISNIIQAKEICGL
ncbi:MAG: DNA repair protein RadA [candidate division WOR-3 bacterium]|nr:DNA repair protein RadA [candidate division WOR-3 bacterium]